MCSDGLTRERGRLRCTVRAVIDTWLTVGKGKSGKTWMRKTCDMVGGGGGKIGRSVVIITCSQLYLMRRDRYLPLPTQVVLLKVAGYSYIPDSPTIFLSVVL